MPVTARIRDKLSQVPHKPGVYLMKDRLATVIYVGKARDLRRRVSQYFHPSRRMGWDLKFNALVDSIHDFDWHVVRNEPESLLLEGKLIKDFKPRFNIDFRDDKRFLLLKVSLNDPIPRFTLTRLRKDDGARYFGPFAHSGALRRTLTMIRRKFHLRGCRPMTPSEADYRHCLYGNLKHCTAPCIGNVTSDEYRSQVEAAADFLAGQSEEMRDEIEAEMRAAAAKLDFEKAAELRDALEDLKRTTEKTGKFERIPYKLPVAINPEADLNELAKVLDLKEPPRRIEGFDISNISGTFLVSSMVSFWNGRPDRSNYRRFKMKSVTQQDDFASMAETIRRRYTRLTAEAANDGTSDNSIPSTKPPDDADSDGIKLEGKAGMTKSRLPDLILIDGGKGQLNAACFELEKLGLGHLAVIGLAKEFEEIHRPEEKEPLRLSHDSGALKLLQRVRDESHRFANTYNAQLRLKKINESLLDEFPGIGEARKQLLLKKFGSVQRLRLASIDEIASVSGFGGENASRLKAFLDARTSGSSANTFPPKPAADSAVAKPGLHAKAQPFREGDA
jgi:excinuclease ABC subunit C